MNAPLSMPSSIQVFASYRSCAAFSDAHKGNEVSND